MTLLIILISMNLCSCFGNGEKDDNYKTPLEETEDLAKDVYAAVIAHDNAKLESLFCEELRGGLVTESDFDKIYEFLDGEIVTLETDWEKDNFADAGGGGKIQGEKYSKTFTFRLYVVTDKGTRYEIGGKGDIYNSIEPKKQGLQVIIIYKQLDNGTWDYVNEYLKIGKELFRDY